MTDSGQTEQNTQENTINPEAQILVYDGHEYVNTPRIRGLITRANEIKKGLPPLEEGMVRLWRGNRPNEHGENPSFTNSLVGIALPFLDSYGGKLTYVDVPKSDLEKYLRTVAVASNAEFMLPKELASTARIVEDTLRPNQERSAREPDGKIDETIPQGWGST